MGGRDSRPRLRLPDPRRAREETKQPVTPNPAVYDVVVELTAP
nr:hypothetical protein [Streptomyces parvus]